MPKWDAELSEWIEFYSPEKMRSLLPDRRPTPVFRFLSELREARKRLAVLDAPDVQFEPGEGT